MGFVLLGVYVLGIWREGLLYKAFAALFSVGPMCTLPYMIPAPALLVVLLGVVGCRWLG